MLTSLGSSPVNGFVATVFEDMEARVGRTHLSKRLALQVDHSARYFGNGFGGFHWENIDLFPRILDFFLRTCGVIDRGRRNTLDYEIVDHLMVLPNLPEAFHDLTMLQLSDIHVDGIPDGGERLMAAIQALTFDVCVMTGDYRFQTYGNYDPSLRGMEKLAEAITCPFGMVGILGNHDFVEMVPLLESYGIKMLLNEALSIEKGGSTLHILGLDDAHFYGVHDLGKALRDLPAGDTKILLAHSPELLAEAAHAGVDCYLCGHTHGGQICLPGGIPILTNAQCPRRYASGQWRYEKTQGYTSRGTGSSGLAVRFYCRPEITLHRLIRPKVSDSLGGRSEDLPEAVSSENRQGAHPGRN